MCADESSSRQQFHVAVTAPDSSAVELLAAASGFSKQQLKKLMQSGAVWLTQGKQTKRLRRAKKALPAGTELHLYYDQKVQQAEIVEPQLLADEGDYSVWVKACGMMSQGSKWGDQGTIARWAEQHLQPQRPAFIVHRLDRATRGLILVAHSKKAVRALTAMFESRQLKKRYRAKVLGDHSCRAQPETITEPIDGRHAVSHVSCVAVDCLGHCSIVDIDIETGRKHQIRRHLAGVGLPIIGDRLYGAGEGAGKGVSEVLVDQPEQRQQRDQSEYKQEKQDLQLAATHLAFVCPLTGQARDYRLPAQYLPRLLGGE